MSSKAFKRRQRFIKDWQMRGMTYEQAVRHYEDAVGLTEVLRDEGYTNATLTEGALDDAVEDWRAIRSAGV